MANIWGADGAYISFASRYNIEISFLFRVTDIIDTFNKYYWVVPLKSRNEGTIIKVFKDVLKSSS